MIPIRNISARPYHRTETLTMMQEVLTAHKVFFGLVLFGMTSRRQLSAYLWMVNDAGAEFSKQIKRLIEGP